MATFRPRRRQIRSCEFRLAVESSLTLSRIGRRSKRSDADWNNRLQLLLGKEILPVLVLTFKLVISAFNGSLLLLQLANLLLKHFHLVTLLQSASDSTLTVLQSLASLFIDGWVCSVVIGATSVDDCLLHVLLLLLRQELGVLKTSGLLILLSMLLCVLVLTCILLDYCLGVWCIKLLCDFVLLHFFLRNLLVFATATLVGDLLEGVIEDDGLRCRICVVRTGLSDGEGWCETTIVRVVVVIPCRNYFA